MCTFYFMDHNKSSRLKNKKNDLILKFFKYFKKSMFHWFEVNRIRSSAKKILFKQSYVDSTCIRFYSTDDLVSFISNKRGIVL